MLLPVVEDLLRRHGPDAGKRVQLFERRRVQMNRAAGCAADTALACLRGRAGLDHLPARNDDLAPVGDLGSEVDETQVGSPGGATGAADRIRDSSAVDEPVEPRPPNRADDVDDEARRRRRFDLPCLGGGRSTVAVPLPTKNRPATNSAATSSAAPTSARARVTWKSCMQSIVATDPSRVRHRNAPKV